MERRNDQLQSKRSRSSSSSSSSDKKSRKIKLSKDDRLSSPEEEEEEEEEEEDFSRPGENEDETSSQHEPDEDEKELEVQSDKLPKDPDESHISEKNKSENLNGSNPTTTTQDSPDLSTPVVFSNGDWQAVYDPQTQAYYYANSRTGETTWENPFLNSNYPTINNNSSSSSSFLNPSSETMQNFQSSAVEDYIDGIDPELAYLDPKTSRRLVDGGQNRFVPTFTAKFNSKTGRFESDPNHDPARVSEYSRARTQARAYFDVEGWEKSLEKNNGKLMRSDNSNTNQKQQDGTERSYSNNNNNSGKKLTKSELEMFKQKKLEKKSMKQRAWLK